MIEWDFLLGWSEKSKSFSGVKLYAVLILHSTKLSCRKMGCMCSKVINRSMSIREDVNHGFQSASTAWEELLTSNSGNDQLFAFLYSANTRTNELRTSSFTLPSTDLETNIETKYFVDSLDLIPDIKAKTELKLTPDDAVGEPDFVRFTRSKSYHLQREKEMPGVIADSEGSNENKLDWKDKNVRGSRSFHTVEEYDALLERIHKSSTRNKESSEDYYYYSSADEKFRQLKSFLDKDQNDGSNIKRNTKDFLDKEGDINDDMDHNSSNSMQYSGVGAEIGHEIGWKRKAAAKGLQSLDVPTIEFPSNARFKQRIHAEGQVYSPGTYVTPKFGSYDNKVVHTREKGVEEEGAENTVFSTELLAAFEDCMEQLQVEEDSILCYMDEYTQIKNGNGDSS